ncbi:hypothetical protein DyAD56_16220 [Dyella sp. AD56]|uniref:hypothetical protein n=1 Tax=Dyella sp. AD56 TaxID=1528744 RepID=UPI000C8394C9|nr:hypothetical protein [Dyella sp. AD56]PMQ04234.1 hypothetical protein DyAD56_16220 [Dyella sp. AD56]
MPAEPVTVEWSPVTITGMTFDPPRFAAYLVEPFHSATFATLSYKPQAGVWALRMLPGGSDGPCAFVDFLTREKAERHAMRWAAHHGRKLPEFANGLRHKPAVR